MAVDPNEARERDLLNRIRVMYGLDPEGASMAGLDQEQRDIQRARDLMAAIPQTITRHDTRDRRRPSTQVTNPAYAREQRRIAELEKGLAERRSGVTVTDDQRQEATANRGLIDDIFNRQRTAALDEGGRELDDRFMNTLRSHRARVGGQGLTGGSVDKSSRRRILADLFRGRQGLRLGADQADQRGRNALEDRRLELERQVKLGTAPDVGTIGALDQQGAAIGEAYNNLPQQALGNLLVTGADLYRTTSDAGASGRRGSGAFSLTSGSAGSSRGSIH